jgi:hypothetical protein
MLLSKELGLLESHLDEEFHHMSGVQLLLNSMLPWYWYCGPKLIFASMMQVYTWDC